jgi:hypothetical protein
MAQQRQVFKPKGNGRNGKPMWAYRYRLNGRGSERPQVGGFASVRRRKRGSGARSIGFVLAVGRRR